MMNDDLANWRAMYMTLFHGINDALELLPVCPENLPAYQAMVKVLLDAEEQYISEEAK